MPTPTTQEQTLNNRLDAIHDGHTSIRGVCHPTTHGRAELIRQASLMSRACRDRGLTCEEHAIVCNAWQCAVSDIVARRGEDVGNIVARG